MNKVPARTGIKPFLRWAGSKRKQLSRLGSFWSDEYSRYIEPFCGSACLFFDLGPKSAVLGDNNSDLIELYRVVRDEPEALYNRLCSLERSLIVYQKWRSLDPKTLDKQTRAVRFLYLNRNCFNGIYRTNAAGQFNVPMGQKPGAYFTLDDLNKCSGLLKKAKLIAGDFDKTISNVKEGDFVYLDPPYAMSTTRRRVFREYGHRSFDIVDIPRFQEALEFIDSRNATFLVSYADCAESRQLGKLWNSIRLPVRRNIAGFADDRRLAYELLVSNTDIPSALKTT